MIEDKGKGKVDMEDMEDMEDKAEDKAEDNTVPESSVVADMD